jgi:hypothetical protein
MLVRRVRRNASRPSGNSPANHRNAGLVADKLEDGAAEATPVNKVTETVVVLPSAAVEGVTLQVEFAGIPVHVNVTVPGTFAAELSSSGKTAFWPFVMVTLVIPFVVN